MELRSCGQLHFIQAVQGGLVTKVLNVTRGRPALTFKKVTDLYEAADVKNHELLQNLHPKDEFETLSFESDRIEVKSPCLPLADRRTIKREPDASDLFCNDGDKIIDSELDGLDLCSMTLKQITERCNIKKRKHSKYVELSNKTGESSSFLKSDYSDFQKEEEDLDLKEPLSSWKSKHSKNVKVKKKGMKNHVLTSSQSAKSIVKSEQVPSDEVLPQCSGDLPAINVKETTATSSCLMPDYSNFQKVEEDLDLKEPLSSWKSKHSKNVKVKKKRMKNHVSTSSSSAKLIVKSEQVPSDEVLPRYITERAINTKDEVSEPDCLDHQNVICVGGDSSLLCHEPEGSCQIMFNEPCEKANAYVSETQIKMSFTREPQYCATNEVCYEYTEPEDPKSGQIVSASARDSMEVGNMVTASHECSDLPVPEAMMKGYTQPVEGDFCLETISSTADHRSHVSGTTQSSSPMNDILLHVNNDIEVPGDAYLFGDGIAAELPSNPKVDVVSSLTSDCSSSPDCFMHSVEDDSPTPEMKQLQNSAFANADINVSAGIYPLTDELMTSVGFEYHHCSNLQHPPARLYPTRKAISPTSQERLLKAMDSNELTENEYYKCRGEFYLGKNKFSSFEGSNQIREDEFSIKPRQIIRKQRSSKKGFPPKAVHKAPYLSYTVPRFSTGCTSIQSCTQSAIEFSQQQMKDFECLAMKLTKELQSMKDTLEERLLPEDCPASSLKFKVDRARMAINNATKVEESTRRWLSMMARDCKRFCKIMGLTGTGSGPSGNLVQNGRKNSTSADEASGVLADQLQRLAETGSASSGNVVHKARKKITFADEAGGKLCHIRVFEDETESVFESNDEKQELLITEL
ncbi:hypothetical protein I3842_15G072600 [Carya illinoinensis]|uniref:Uncharacterized protein n=1 Tax=Carya illinoinensis TaxID=32201 RepID=A0A922A6R0_CARIL|nr:hypothetical protein I3842_15G072600 [Carya illinoinensis]